MKYQAIITFIFLCISMAGHGQEKQFLKNPIVQGYFADPTIIKDKGVYYIYATIDPWGSDELAVLQTKDFSIFTQKHLNWPTKLACTSLTSNKDMVWAPSVVKGKDHNFYMYVAVGSEIWAGVSNSPLGPWKNIKPDNSPLIKATEFTSVHNIDPDCFIDEDGQAIYIGVPGLNGKTVIAWLLNLRMTCLLLMERQLILRLLISSKGYI